MNQEILSFLEMIGVNTQFVSLYEKSIFTNNLKFSRFSRKREEMFLKKFPEWKVVRSKVFQKMCVRASRILSKSLKPKDKVYVEKNNSCTSLALYIILEPYTRKYGVEIVYYEDPNAIRQVDLVASPLTLDEEVGNIIKQMLHGEKMELTVSKTEEFKTIYPLINIPDSWIESWISEYGFTCTNPPVDTVSNDLMEFLEEFIHDVRENMLKSALFYMDRKSVNYPASAVVD